MCLYVFLCVNKCVDISMAVICYASDFTEYDWRTLELSNAALHITQDINSIEKKTLKLLKILNLPLDEVDLVLVVVVATVTNGDDGVSLNRRLCSFSRLRPRTRASDETEARFDWG